MKYTPRKVTFQMSPVDITLPPYHGSVDSTTLVYPPEINPLEDRVYPAPKSESWKTDSPYDKSFKKVKQLREIKMTDYSKGNVQQTWSLARIPRRATAYASYSWVPLCKEGAPTPYVWKGGSASTYYDDNYDLIRAADNFPAVEYTESPTPETIKETLNDLKAKVVQDSYSGFDALTELAEFPETLGMLISLFKVALRPLQGIKELRKKYERARRRGKTHDEAHGEIASQWMQYRYGIMPLVYSIQDTIKLLDESFNEFKTDRTFAVLRSKPKSIPNPENTHIAIYRSYEFKINVIGKARFSTQSSRLKDLITTNLFVTAWELIPMSFVIDWFINVGDVIATSTSGMMDLSEERKFCYSIRRSMIDKHVLNWRFTDGITKIRTDYVDNPCKGGRLYDRGVESFSDETLNLGSAVLYERVEESYERFVFQPNTIDLKFGPDLNWMRAIDGYVLSFNQVRKVLKTLR